MQAIATDSQADKLRRHVEGLLEKDKKFTGKLEINVKDGIIQDICQSRRIRLAQK